MEFILPVKYRLGLPVYPAAGPCETCGSPSDEFGDHAIASCSATGDKIRRHDILRNRLFDAASAALLAPRKEVRGLDLASQQKPGDVVISNWELSPGSTKTAFDVTVASPR